MQMTHKSQQHVLKGNIKISASVPLEKNPIGLIRALNHKQQRFLDMLLRFYKAYGVVTLSHKTMAKRVGVCISTIKRYIIFFENLGLIKTFYRHLKTLIIDVTDILFRPHVRTALAVLFRCLAFTFSLQLLASPAFEIRPLKVAPDHDELLININGVNFINSTVCSVGESSSYVCACAREGQTADKKTENCTEHTKKEREAMTVNGIPDYIREISCMKLTDAGQIKLSAFPVEAIEYATKTMKMAGNKRDPFRWFFKVCNDFCKESNIQPDWKRKSFLETTYGISDNDVMITELPKPQPSFSGTPKTGKTTSSSDVYITEMEKQRERVDAEDPYQAALKLERAYAKVTHGFKFNVWLARLTPEQQEEIRMTVQAEQSGMPMVKITVPQPEPAPAQVEPTGDQWFDGSPIIYEEFDDYEGSVALSPAERIDDEIYSTR